MLEQNLHRRDEHDVSFYISLARVSRSLSFLARNTHRLSKTALTDRTA